MNNQENTVQDNREYWIPAFEQGNKQRNIFAARSSSNSNQNTAGSKGITIEEARNMPVKPF